MSEHDIEKLTISLTRAMGVVFAEENDDENLYDNISDFYKQKMDRLSLLFKDILEKKNLTLTEDASVEDISKSIHKLYTIDISQINIPCDDWEDLKENDKEEFRKCASFLIDIHNK